MLQYNLLQPFKIAFGYNVITCYFWVMDTQEQSVFGVVNPLYTPELKSEPISKLYSRCLATPKELLKEVFPIPNGNRLYKIIYNALMFIDATPRCTGYYLSDNIGSDKRAINKVVHYLLEYGYIKVLPRRTFIIPFNAYKLDKTYVITAKGKSVLHKLINY